METFLKFLGGLLLVFGTIIYNAFVWGFVVYKLYNWFVLPNIELPHFTVSQFTGFTLFLSAIMPIVKTHIKDEYEKETSYVIVFGLIYPWTTLLGAWLVSLFI